MIDSELAISVLQGIREDLARSNRDSNERLDGTSERLDAMRAEREAYRRESNQHFDAIEFALREIAEQLVVLSRDVKVAAEV